MHAKYQLYFGGRYVHRSLFSPERWIIKSSSEAYYSGDPCEEGTRNINEIDIWMGGIYPDTIENRTKANQRCYRECGPFCCSHSTPTILSTLYLLQFHINVECEFVDWRSVSYNGLLLLHERRYRRVLFFYNIVSQPDYKNHIDIILYLYSYFMDIMLVCIKQPYWRRELV
jgi:hypothetical protein